MLHLKTKTMPDLDATIFLYSLHLDLTLPHNSDETAQNFVCLRERLKMEFISISNDPSSSGTIGVVEESKLLLFSFARSVIHILPLNFSIPLYSLPLFSLAHLSTRIDSTSVESLQLLKRSSYVI